MAKNFLKSSLENASLNIILQISFRLVTFLLNAFVIRRVSQDAIGVMYVRLLLLESTILSLSRDAFRKACVSRTDSHNWPQVINLMWLTVPLSSILCVIFGYIWLHVLTPPSENVTQYYTFGVMAVTGSCILEMFSEPLYLVSQAFLFVKLRVFADIIQMFVRTVTFVLLILKSSENAVLAFSVAQILSVSSYVLFLYAYFYFYIKRSPKDFPFRSMNDFFPKKLQDVTIIDWRLFKLIRSFIKQSIMMQLLTEGEKYVMTVVNILSFSEQGVFDVVNNLGSLAARFIFRHIEESAYFYFSQLVHRDEDIKKQKKTLMDEAAFMLENLLRIVTSLGLLVLFFGQAYARMALFWYGGEKLAYGLGTKLLKTHCLAILLMAINGSTECYAFSTMNTMELNKYNRIMVFFSVGFLLAVWILSYLFGSVGFILANCLNMTARIISSCVFIHSRYKNTSYKPLSGLLPRMYFFITLCLSFIITTSSEMYFVTLNSETKLLESTLIVHFTVGGICFLFTIFVWWYQERKMMKSLVHILKFKSE